MSNKFVKVEKTEDDSEDGVEIEIKTIGDVDPKEMKLVFADSFFESMDDMGMEQEEAQEFLDALKEAFSPENIEETLANSEPLNLDDLDPEEREILIQRLEEDDESDERTLN